MAALCLADFYIIKDPLVSIFALNQHSEYQIHDTSYVFRFKALDHLETIKIAMPLRHLIFLQDSLGSI